MLLPPSLDDLIAEQDSVRVVNEIIERIAITELERSYKGGGTSRYHRQILLKVLVYGYLESEIGIKKRREGWKVKAVFSNIKHNKGFKRFNLRGLEKAEVEVDLMAIAQNLNHYGVEKANKPHINGRIIKNQLNSSIKNRKSLKSVYKIRKETKMKKDCLKILFFGQPLFLIIVRLF